MSLVPHFHNDSIVRLKSGGPSMLFSHYVPKMRVSMFSLQPPYGCFCIWFDFQGHKQTGYFEAEHLELVP